MIYRRLVCLLWASLVICVGAFPAFGEDPQAQTFTITLRDRKVTSDSGVIRVQQGDRVTLRWSTDETVTLHLHGYDLEKAVTPKAPAVFTFEAHATGRFPITAHGFGKEHEERTLVYLEVLPR